MAGKEDKDSVQKHISMCTHCISVSEKAAEHGLGVDTVRRADVIQTDHFILEDDQKQLAGCTLHRSTEHSGCGYKVRNVHRCTRANSIGDSSAAADTLGTVLWYTIADYQ